MINIPLKYYKYCRLVINFLVLISMGATNEILGPTMPDLSIRVGEDYSVVGRTYSIRIGASMVTPFIVGALFDRYPRTREFGIGLIPICAGIAEMGIPFCRQIWTLTLALSVQGFFFGAMPTACQSVVIELFGVSAMAALQFMHLGWGVGCILGSLIVRPFLALNLKLSKKQIKYSCLVNMTSNSSLDGNASSINASNEGSTIEYAYIIICSYAIFMGIVGLLFSFLPKPRRPNDTDSNANSKKSLKQMLGPSSISDGKPVFGAFMLVSLTLIYTIDVGTFMCLTTFLVTIAIDPCKPFTMTQSNATLLQSIRAICFSCSRVIFGVSMIILIAKKIQPGIAIGICSIGMTISMVLLSTIGYQNEVAFWILNCTYAIFHAPYYGGCTPWLNQYIRVTSSVIALAVIGTGVGKSILIWLGGYILRETNSQTILFLTTSLVLSLMVIIISTVIISMKVGKRPTFENPQATKKDLETDVHASQDTLPLAKDFST